MILYQIRAVVKSYIYQIMITSIICNSHDQDSHMTKFTIPASDLRESSATKNRSIIFIDGDSTQEIAKKCKIKLTS